MVFDMFRGQFIHKISKTGRISVPSKFRDNLKKKFKTNFLVLSTFEDWFVFLRILEVAHC